MHEISLMTSVMDIAEQELRAHGASRLTLVRVRFGVLSHVEPEAMRMAFAALTAGGPHEGARLELEEEALELRCRACGHVFSSSDRDALLSPCPACAAVRGFAVESGEGLFLDHLEAE